MTTYSINGVTVQIAKLGSTFQAWVTDASDDIFLQACQFGSEKLSNKNFKTQKEIKKLVDDFSMKVFN
jgi:hypothetical protein